MRKFEEHQRLGSLFFWLLLLFMLFLMLRPAASFPQGVQNAFVRTKEVKINAKTLDGVSVTERYFGVTDTAVIVDLNGKKITLTDLPVPCLARIKYALQMDQAPVAIGISVVKTFPSSSRSWFHEVRER